MSLDAVVQSSLEDEHEALENLINEVIVQIRKDISDKEYAPLFELLELLPTKALKSFLTEANEHDYYYIKGES